MHNFYDFKSWFALISCNIFCKIKLKVYNTLSRENFSQNGPLILWCQGRDVASLKVKGVANFENLPMRIGVRIRRVRCEWWQLEAAGKADRNYLHIRANVFFMTVKNLQKIGFSTFQYFLLQFASNEDTNLFLWIFWGKKNLSNRFSSNIWRNIMEFFREFHITFKMPSRNFKE